ncbi:hypothetical protein [Corynebacterium sp. H130]|uniref:hypothetical protein n=1 Tax=Corynebacterium sp. H130 TaxID=3133444 RepID=UPI0030980C66
MSNYIFNLVRQNFHYVLWFLLVLYGILFAVTTTRIELFEKPKIDPQLITDARKYYYILFHSTLGTFSQILCLRFLYLRRRNIDAPLTGWLATALGMLGLSGVPTTLYLLSLRMSDTFKKGLFLISAYFIFHLTKIILPGHFDPDFGVNTFSKGAAVDRISRLMVLTCTLILITYATGLVIRYFRKRHLSIVKFATLNDSDIERYANDVKTAERLHIIQGLNSSVMNRLEVIAAYAGQMDVPNDRDGTTQNRRHQMVQEEARKASDELRKLLDILREKDATGFEVTSHESYPFNQSIEYQLNNFDISVLKNVSAAHRKIFLNLFKELPEFHNPKVKTIEIISAEHLLLRAEFAYPLEAKQRLQIREIAANDQDILGCHRWSKIVTLTLPWGKSTNEFSETSSSSRL